MKQYNFDERIRREHTGCVKWDNDFKTERKDILPLWVADMDFACSEPIQKALREHVDEQIYGYSLGYDDAYRSAVCGWFSRRFDWNIQKEDIFYAPGVVPAISWLIQCLSEAGDKVVIQTPVYHPFKAKIEDTNRIVKENPLLCDHGNYRMDLNGLKECFEDPSVKGLLLCSPHNPVGRVWTKEELKAVIELAHTYDKWIISDEIHCDIIAHDQKHHPIATLCADDLDRIIVCTAPSKSFNLAGLQNSNIIIHKEEYKKRWKQFVSKTLSLSGPNSFAIRATKAAYNESEDWLDQVNAYIDGNDQIACALLRDLLPKAIITPREGTYLMWVDLHAYVKDAKELETKLRNAGIILNEGYIFGDAGACFERINLACPRSIVKECIERMSQVLG